MFKKVIGWVTIALSGGGGIALLIAWLITHEIYLRFVFAVPIALAYGISLVRAKKKPVLEGQECQ